MRKRGGNSIRSKNLVADGKRSPASTVNVDTSGKGGSERTQSQDWIDAKPWIKGREAFTLT